MEHLPQPKRGGQARARVAAVMAVKARRREAGELSNCWAPDLYRSPLYVICIKVL